MFFRQFSYISKTWWHTDITSSINCTYLFFLYRKSVKVVAKCCYEYNIRYPFKTKLSIQGYFHIHFLPIFKQVLAFYPGKFVKRLIITLHRETKKFTELNGEMHGKGCTNAALTFVNDLNRRFKNTLAKSTQNRNELGHVFPTLSINS